MLLSAARAMLNEAGIAKHHDALARARQAVVEGPDLVASARNALVTALEHEKQQRQRYDDALVEAEWVAESMNRFVVEGNRTFLVATCPAEHTTADDETARCSADRCDGTGELRRQMTADQKAAYIKGEAKKRAEVVRAAKDLAEAEHAAALAKVDVDTAENRWQAARYAAELARTDADLAITHLACLARTLTPTEHAL
jgi:hypothetical protein